MNLRNASLTILSTAGVIFALITLDSSSDRLPELRLRASKVFAYDRVPATHAKLPANQLYALSIALQFGDETGAEKLLTALERRI